MFSKTFAYALRATTYVARKGKDDRKVNLEELSLSIQLSPHYLRKIMQKLVRMKILNSTKGPGGGFWMDDEKAKLSIYELLTAVEGEHVVNSCIMGKLKCDSKIPCPMHEEYANSKARLFALMKKTTIEDWNGAVLSKDLCK
jgi:Rrf2 family transcriptional regulator, iron-sulfur cluster assembly transcription factor